jgi:hypothetical protein
MASWAKSLASNHEKGLIMKKTISIYWPLAVIVPFAVIAGLHTYGARAPRPLAAERVTAELARTVSYGLIVNGAPRALPAARPSAPFGVSEAS